MCLVHSVAISTVPGNSARPTTLNGSETTVARVGEPGRLVGGMYVSKPSMHKVKKRTINSRLDQREFQLVLPFLPDAYVPEDEVYSRLAIQAYCFR